MSGLISSSVYYAGTAQFFLHRKSKFTSDKSISKFTTDISKFTDELMSDEPADE
jgi:hypothetical protein